MITENTTLNELYNYACNAAETIAKEGEEFRVRDLFVGIEWDRIPKALRTKLGSMFLFFVNNHSDKYVAVRKTAQNQQIYRKIKS